MESTKQLALWLAPHASGRLHASRSFPVDVEGGKRPTRLWTLYAHTDPNVAPTLPYIPVHLNGAFLEDYVHDWDWNETGVIRYYSRVISAMDGVWLLLEWK